MQAAVHLGLLMMSAARAAPLLDARDVASNGGPASTPVGEPSTDRTIVVTIALVSMGLMCFFLGLYNMHSVARFKLIAVLGFRFNKLKRSIFMRRNVMSTMVLIIFLQILSFIILTTVLVAGQGLMTYELCTVATWVCLIGYTFTKFMIFLFLVERVHIVRAPFMTRKQDKIYIGCVLMILAAFGPLAIKSYIDPMIFMDPKSGRCRAGIRRSATLPTIAVNSIVDLVLTGVFFYLLRPVVKCRLPAISTVLGARRSSQQFDGQTDANETSVQRSMRALVWKSIIGSILIELPMIANMIQMAVTNGEELGMICLTICLVEVVWDALVIYWLTFGSSAQAEKNMHRSATLSSKATLVQLPAMAFSRRGSMNAGEKPVSVDMIRLEMPPRSSVGDEVSLSPPRIRAEGI